jgi:transmembrane sensor
MASASEIEEQAAKWLIKLDAGATSEDWARHARWLADSPRHRAAFLRLSRAWSGSNALRKLRPLDCHVDPDLLAPAESRRPRLRDSRHLRGLALAASLMLAVVSVFAGRAATAPDELVYETKFATTQLVSLADGSQINLNGDSVIRVSYTPTVRDVVIERGEALFDVAADAKRPFRVSAGKTLTTTLTSRFSVHQKAADTTEVLVSRGQVVFERARPPLYFTGSGARFMHTLWAGTVANANDGGVSVRTIGTAAVQRRLAWVHGQVVFLGETLHEAVLQINRYNRQQLVIADPKIGRLRVSGTFAATDPKSFVASLEKPLHVRARPQTDRIRLVSSKP